MRRHDDRIEVIGGGPAGLAAATTLARGGRRVVVHEARPGIGHRFGGDLQGLENWTTTTNVLDGLRELGITTGYHFETDMPDGIGMILDDDDDDDEDAPQGYSYLLVMQGRGTVKSCMFSGFKQEQIYVERTVDRFQRLVGLGMRNPRAHGGIGNFRVPATAVSGGRPIAGEQAGFQDAFAGFGMRCARLPFMRASPTRFEADPQTARLPQRWNQKVENRTRARL